MCRSVAEEPRPDELGAECRLLNRYLIGTDVASDVVTAYVRAHQFPGIATRSEPGDLDRALLRIAGIGPGFARAADAYAAVFARTSLLRRKLVLLVAILESRGDSAAALDTASPGPRLVWMLGAAAQAGAGVARVAGVAFLLPAVYLWCRLASRRRGRLI